MMRYLIMASFKGNRFAELRETNHGVMNTNYTFRWKSEGKSVHHSHFEIHDLISTTSPASFKVEWKDASKLSQKWHKSVLCSVCRFVDGSIPSTSNFQLHDCPFSVMAYLPLEIMSIICTYLSYEQDFKTLFSCACAGKELALVALSRIYR